MSLLISAGIRRMVPTLSFRAARATSPSLHLKIFSTAVANNTVTVTIDGNKYEVENDLTILQACESAGISVPRFCYHERLSIAGNCRMCLVEVVGGPPKPVASCAMPVMPDMVINTTSPLAKKAREGVMEFLLLNHPLDCPICDQGGECDLQDQAMVFGSDRSRFFFQKRTVNDKNMGPLIKTIMTRCIHCTRCIRFATEVAGVEAIGTVGRGRDTEVSTYVERLFDSEMSGNVIDLCPVGALTSKPYAFTARNWELKNTESIDVLDAVGSNILICSRGTEVMRIMPRLNEDINEEWISDKSRFSYDGLKRQRLDTPMVKIDGQLTPTTWPEALSVVAEKLQNTSGDKMQAFFGPFSDAESIMALKNLMNRLGSEEVGYVGLGDRSHLSADLRAGYLTNTAITGIDEADCVLLLGSNPRWEAPIVNTRLRKMWLHKGLQVARVGEPVDLTYDVEEIGDGADALLALASGKHPFSEQLKQASRPMIIVGHGFLGRPDAGTLMPLLEDIIDKHGIYKPATEDDPAWNGYSVLHTSVGQVTGLELGLGNATDRKSDVVYVMGADDFEANAIQDDSFVIYQGHHGDRGATRADVILPSTAYTEKGATYVNTEGRAQQTLPAVVSPGLARDDWKIIRALSEIMQMTLPYDSLAEIRAKFNEIAPSLTSTDTLLQPDLSDPLQLKASLSKAVETSSPVDKSVPFQSPIKNFYMTDVISRSSQTMAKCTSAFLQK